MRTYLLISVAVLLPLVWGWGMHRLLAALWPTRKPGSGRGRGDGSQETATDYQI